MKALAEMKRIYINLSINISIRKIDTPQTLVKQGFSKTQVENIVEQVENIVEKAENIVEK